MTYLTKEQAAQYVTYAQMQELQDGIDLLKTIINDKMTGGDDTPENASPIWGDIAVISANYDESFFIRWSCRDPKGRDLEFQMKVNTGDYFNIHPWYNGIHYTCFIPKGHAKVGLNTYQITANNNVYESESGTYNVTIPKVHVPIPPTISQNIGDVSGKIGQAVTISYTASDDGSISKHFFGDGLKEEDITSKVTQKGTTYSYTTTWISAIQMTQAYFRVQDNEGLSSSSNKFKITIT